MAQIIKQVLVLHYQHHVIVTQDRRWNTEPPSAALDP